MEPAMVGVGRRSRTVMGGLIDEVASVVAHPLGFAAFTLAAAGLVVIARQSRQERLREDSVASWSLAAANRRELRDAVASPRPVKGLTVADPDAARSARLRGAFAAAVKDALADAHEGGRRLEGPGSR